MSSIQSETPVEEQTNAKNEAALAASAQDVNSQVEDQKEGQEETLITQVAQPDQNSKTASSDYQEDEFSQEREETADAQKKASTNEAQAEAEAEKQPSEEIPPPEGRQSQASKSNKSHSKAQSSNRSGSQNRKQSADQNNNAQQQEQQPVAGISERASSHKVVDLTQVSQNQILTMDQATENESASKGPKTMSNFRSSQVGGNSTGRGLGMTGRDSLTKAERVANLSPLKYMHRAPIPRFSYGLDSEERELIARGQDLSKQEIWELLERKRFQELKKAAVSLQGELMVHKRCPKCTLVPPCAHYESPDKIVSDAPKIMGSPKFKEVLSPTKRNNLLKMVKSQTNNMYEQSLNYQNENSYYIDTLQGMNGGLPEDENAPGNPISINRVQHATLPVGFHEQGAPLVPEKDMMYESRQNTFGRRRRTTGPTKLEPLPGKKGGFLRKGEGNGGSPTNFVLRQQVKENGQLVLEPIAKRTGALSTVRKRDRSGGFTYTKGSVASLHGKNPEDLSPRQKDEMERKQRIQEKIAEFRLIRFQKEQEKVTKQQAEAEAERIKLQKQQERRRRYMDTQKMKLQDYQINRATQISQTNLLNQEKQRQKAAAEAKKRAGDQYERQKALAQWRAEKQKAEKMLLMAPPSQEVMKEQPDYEETSVHNDTHTLQANATTSSVQKKQMSTVFTNQQAKHDRQQYAQDANTFNLEEDQNINASAPPKEPKTPPVQDSNSQQQKATVGKSYQFQLINDEEENDYSQENYSQSQFGTSSAAPKQKKGQEKMYKTQQSAAVNSQKQASVKKSVPKASSYSNSGFDNESAPIKSVVDKKSAAPKNPSKRVASSGNQSLGEDYSQDYSEMVSNNGGRLDSLPNQQPAGAKPSSIANTPSMAQLQASPNAKAQAGVTNGAKQNILVMQSKGNTSEQYTEENLSYEMNQQVASPQAFAAAKQTSRQQSKDKSESQSKIDGDGSEFFLDEDNISVEK